MNKRLTKPYEKNVRLSTPTGLLGVPPEAAEDGGDTYIIVTDKKTAESFIENFFSTNKKMYDSALENRFSSMLH